MANVNIFQSLKKHLIFDAILVGIGLLTIAGVWNHYEGLKIYADLSAVYLLCFIFLLLHQAIFALITRDGSLAHTFFFLGIFYFFLGMAGLTVFVVRSFAW